MHSIKNAAEIQYDNWWLGLIRQKSKHCITILCVANNDDDDDDNNTGNDNVEDNTIQIMVMMVMMTMMAMMTILTEITYPNDEIGMMMRKLQKV